MSQPHQSGKKTTLPNVIEEYLSSRIYNADETAMFYHAVPDGS